ncbi:hypothetical protein [Nocardia asiatica]|uniref:hypothetical protein n=1 Tax=Nocardia asiatica TaxID=209252 RepID=UPI002454E19E|nr:hypothetical protein [Nocardia asiatica]
MALIVCTIEDIDAGVIYGHKKLPELLFADERTKASVDFLRTAEPASELSNATRHEVTEPINATGAVTPRSRKDERLRFEVSSAAGGNPFPPHREPRSVSTRSTPRSPPPVTPAPASGGARPPAPVRCGTSPAAIRIEDI